MNLDAIAIGHKPPEDVNTIIEVPIGGNSPPNQPLPMW